MLVVRTSECRADSLGQLVGSKQPLRLYNLALAVDPLGLYRIEPRALFWQQAAYDPHSSFAAAPFNLSVVRGDPLSNLFGDVPACVVPDQHPYPLACCFELLGAPRKETSSYPAHRVTIDKAHQQLLKLGHIKPVAGDGFGIRVVFGDRLLEEAQRFSLLAPAMQRGQSRPTPPALITETHCPGVGMLGRHPHQSLAPPFSRILRIWGSDPAFGPLPAHSQARKRCPDGLARDLLFGEPFFEADLGGHLQSPKATLFAEFARVLMKQLAQSLSLLRIESPVNSMRMLRTWLKRLRESLLVESVDGVARRLRIAAQFVSDLVGVFASVASEQDLATAQGEGIRRAQACLQGLTLGVAQGTHEDRSFHRVEDNHQLPCCLERH